MQFAEIHRYCSETSRPRLILFICEDNLVLSKGPIRYQIRGASMENDVKEFVPGFERGGTARRHVGCWFGLVLGRQLIKSKASQMRRLFQWKVM